MMRYKQQEDFEDDYNSSIGSVILNSDGISATATHVRFHSGTSLWRSRTTLEKCFFIVCVSLILIIIVLAISIGSERHICDHGRGGILHVTSVNKEKSHCLTEHCVAVAASIINSMDMTIHPCDDFYQYACGGWISKNPIPDGKSIWGTFGKLEQDNQLVVKNVLERPLAEMKSQTEKKAKQYYLSCLDANETIENLGAKPMLDLLENVGGWSISGKFDVKRWSFQENMHVLQNVYNMGGLFSWAVSEDDRNSSRYIIEIDQGGLTLPTTDNYLNKTEHGKVLVAYLDYMTKIGVLLGGEENSTRKKMQNIIDFETKIAEITTPQEERRDEEKMYNLMTLQELQEKAPFFSWLKYFQNATSLLNKTISNQMKVVVYAPDYLRKLTELVRDYKKTDEKKTILNDYLVWQTVRTLTSCLSKPFRDAYKGLRKALIGSEGHEEQWRFCVNDANNVMGFAIGAMFVREVFHGKSKPMAEEMINEIRSAFTKNLKNLDWMDAETRKSAEQKANAITDMIGFPDFILNPSEIDDGFKNLQINPNEYFMNNIRINVFTLKKNLEKLDQPVNKTSWIMTPPTVNAYYTPTKNQIVFPAGILQSPFFDMKNPSSLNFGGMGVVMGHELTHAFDDLGREYDLNGNLHQWWNNATIDRFKNRTECFVDQYHNYEIKGRRVNGRQTLGENIADNGGLKAAYHAYLAKHKNMDDLLSLPGLDLSHEQLFFVNFAQVWCSAATTEAVSLQIEKDSHCPAKYRVIGPLSNLEEFSREFNCPKGSRMNPIHKCEVW
ncbi:endothelin-converting enzyme homolog isoform X2 [Trichogramma pretiosum]|nr:endothelin-converting enzyme homolog isoform X2 [Trichogramma pretiosum]XP_014223620.1 endothelin-converting enzyme homolog isoform X2 [Trichogramma pretiosum]XP_014223621.1 endothelin-converting enzyme homolog isoform X2 [Trichogramma pretiosum]XP_023316999.1 endothelin-converting enzyme homolog isoform X2 [Trichogramma pretiosum]XP_023317000.1 endothelin-converting enzyme homolog isoform X2 [Trichogramma pretiosum]